MLNDIRYGLRQLSKHPGFTIIAVLTLALGIGANTAIFSVVNAVLLKPLPFPAPEELVAVGMTDTRQKATQTDLGSLSYPDFFDFREQNRTLASIAVYRGPLLRPHRARKARPACRGDQSRARSSSTCSASSRCSAAAFARADEQAGGGPGGFKVILSHDFWQKHFGGDANVLGRTIDARSPPVHRHRRHAAGFQFPIQTEPLELYVTIAEDAANPDGSPNRRPSSAAITACERIARLKPGVTHRAGAGRSCGHRRRAREAISRTRTPTSASRSKPLREDLIGDVRTALYVLFGAVVCVLLIANANVANLLLARASVRGKEIALRAAMGASRARIIRQLLTESLLLSGLGGLLGLLIAQWGTEALIKTVPQNIPRIATSSSTAPCSASPCSSRSPPASSSASSRPGRRRTSI